MRSHTLLCWLCLSLALAGLAGMHWHVESHSHGTEARHSHLHVADNGLLTGAHHSEALGEGDERDLDAVQALTSKPLLDLSAWLAESRTGLPPAKPMAAPALLLARARGPPVIPRLIAHHSPPICGPPNSLLT